MTIHLPPEVSTHVAHAEQMAHDILSPGKPTERTYYHTPCHHHRCHDSWFFPRTVHHYHHTPSSSDGASSSSRPQGKSDKRKEELMVAAIFTVASLVLAMAFASEMGTLHNSSEDLKKLSEERELAHHLLDYSGSDDFTVHYHPKAGKILNQLTKIYNIEKEILETYRSESSSRLFKKGATLVGAATTAIGAFASSAPLIGGGALLFAAAGLTWAISSCYNTATRDVERKAESLLSEIQVLKLI